MKRVLRTFVAGTRVYAAGGELPNTHPVVTSCPMFFEDVPAPAPKRTRKRKSKDSSQGQGHVDGDT